jgi:phosphatidylcholine synthase
MKRYLYLFPHILTLSGLAFAMLAIMAAFEGRLDSAARLCLLVLLVDRFDGTLARRFGVRKHFPGISGEALDMITDLVGLTLAPMMLFWRSGLFLDGYGAVIACAALITASYKYSRKESFLSYGYSIGAPPIFFSVFLFYFLNLPPIYPTVYIIILICLVLSPVKYPITSLVTTHWKPGYKSLTNYLTILFFIPVFIYLQEAPAWIYWIMLIAILIQLMAYPMLLSFGVFKPVFDRNS